MENLVSVETIDQAASVVSKVVKKTPLQFVPRLSKLYKAKIYFKREDLQDVRSYKIRGAFNLMSSLSEKQRAKGAVCASAGNHAQGVAFSASHLKIKATIFMPTVTPLQKIGKVRNFGGKWVTIELVGKTFDESSNAAKEYCKKIGASFIHPFDDPKVISGQGTVGKEIYEQSNTKNLDFVICPIGGGGLISGVSTYLKGKDKKIEIIGTEPMGAASMDASFKAQKIVTLNEIDTFVDGAAVKTVGINNYLITSQHVKKIIPVPEGKVCTTMIELYQNEGIIAEPAGALSIASLDFMKEQIKGKNVVCVLSGGNNDILRYPEIMEKSLVYQGLKHYFLLEFAQKPGQLRRFLDKALGKADDIVRFEYIKKSSKELGPALVGIELTKSQDYEPLIKRMSELGINYTVITSSDILYRYLV